MVVTPLAVTPTTARPGKLWQTFPVATLTSNPVAVTVIAGTHGGLLCSNADSYSFDNVLGETALVRAMLERKGLPVAHVAVDELLALDSVEAMQATLRDTLQPLLAPGPPATAPALDDVRLHAHDSETAQEPLEAARVGKEEVAKAHAALLEVSASEGGAAAPIGATEDASVHEGANTHGSMLYVHEGGNSEGMDGRAWNAG